MKSGLIIILTSLSISSIGQVLNYSTSIDFDKDGIKETLLFYDEYNSEFEETEFTKFCIVKKNDTICGSNDNVWVLREDLYSKVDINISNRIGIITADDNIYLWLTGFQYGCCPNNTTIYQWVGNDLIEVFNKDFYVKDIRSINGKKFVIGDFADSEQHGGGYGYLFQTFFPTEYRILDKDMEVDKILTQKKNLENWKYLEVPDVYNAEVLILTDTKEKFLISDSLAELLSQRDYGITSITKLSKDFISKRGKEMLKLMRNEIFAIYGYSFNSPDLKAHFESKSWYKSTNKTAEEIYNQLSDIEKYNLNLIREVEKNDP